jgi:hypothetical protein
MQQGFSADALKCWRRYRVVWILGGHNTP